MQSNLRFLKMLLLFAFFLFSCNNYNRDEIKKMLKSGDKNQQMEAVYLIGKNRDSVFINEIFQMAYDPRVTHKMQFLGMSIHQSCMNALKKITQVSPPNKIEYHVDSVNIDFYKNLLRKQ